MNVLIECAMLTVMCLARLALHSAGRMRAHFSYTLQCSLKFA